MAFSYIGCVVGVPQAAVPEEPRKGQLRQHPIELSNQIIVLSKKHS